MKRANSVTDALNTGNALLDFGDNLPKVAIPLDGDFGGEPGPPGAGVPTGGSALQMIRKNAANTTTEWADVNKSLVGLNNVDNTSDVNKPVSNATQTALGGKADKTELNNKADLVGGKIPVAQLPATGIVTDSSVAAQVNSPETGAEIDGRITTQATPLVQPIVADYIASSQVVVDAAAAAVDANPKIATLEQENVAQSAAIIARVPFRQVAGNIDLNTLMVTEDVLLTTVSGVINAPDTSAGMVSVRNGGGNISQTWVALVRKTGFSLSRVYAQGVWGEWVLTGPEGVTPVRSASFDSMRTVGTYRIQFTDHPGQPIAATGALRVIPAAGTGLVQELITWESPPRKAERRSTGATTWGPWGVAPTSAQVAAIESTSAMTAKATIAAPVRGVLIAPALTVISKNEKDIMTALSIDRTHGWNSYGSVLKVTWDDGDIWEDVYTFAGNSMESVVQTADGELLVTAHNGALNRRQVWKSSGYGTPGVTFAVTHTARVAGVKYTSAWSQSAHGRIVLLNEYGPKSGATWSGVDGIVAEGDNARLTYLSMDYGRTWKTIFDLNSYLTADRGLTSTDGQHLHGVVWDPYWDRIWISFGDDTDGIVYSDNLGATWRTAVWSPQATSSTQGVGIVALPRCILIGSDNYNPSTVYRINRAEGKSRAGTYTLDSAWEFTGGGKHLMQAKVRADRVGSDAPTFLGFCAEGVASKSFVVATMDGYTFQEVWRDPVEQNAGFGTRNVVGPTARGNIVISSHDQKVAGSWSQIRGTAPGY